MTRTRSNSVGVRRRTAATATVSNEGVNLYERAAPSAQFESMIEANRDEFIAKLERPLASKRTINQVVWVEELSEGARQFDKFRITSDSPDGFTHAERVALEKLVYRLLPSASPTVFFALVDQARYDTRVCGCDLVRAQLCLIVLLYVVSLALLGYLGSGVLEDRNADWYSALTGLSPLDPINS